WTAREGPGRCALRAVSRSATSSSPCSHPHGRRALEAGPRLVQIARVGRGGETAAYLVQRLPPLVPSPGGPQPSCIARGRAQLQGTSRLPARELDSLAEARLHACGLSVLPCKQLGTQPMQLGFEQALVGGHAEGLVDRRGGLFDRTRDGVRLPQPAEVETVRAPLAGGELRGEPIAELPDALVVPAVRGEGSTADDRRQTHEQREAMLGREGDERVDVFERALWLPEEDVECAREEARPRDRERIPQVLRQLERLAASLARLLDEPERPRVDRRVAQRHDAGIRRAGRSLDLPVQVDDAGEVLACRREVAETGVVP